jgi:colanic acid biosynthesis protein WcaH
MNINEAINFLDECVPNPKEGLPDEIFYYISRTTPLINVDLLIKDEKGRSLLGWRDDQYTGRGWHVPGGIIRFKENAETRIKKVAEIEIGAQVRFDPNPIAINEIIKKEGKIRGHFISLLYKCSLLSTFVPENRGLTETDPGFLKWHDKCPDNLLSWHEIYRKYL